MECARCGCQILAGETHYIVSITLVADFDGTIPESVNPTDVQALWRQIESKSQEELEDEVYQKLTFMMCKRCRDEYIKNPAGRPAGECSEFGSPH